MLSKINPFIHTPRFPLIIFSFLAFFGNHFSHESIFFISDSVPLEQIVSVDCKAEGFRKQCKRAGTFLLKLLLPFSLQIMVLRRYTCANDYTMCRIYFFNCSKKFPFKSVILKRKFFLDTHKGGEGEVTDVYFLLCTRHCTKIYCIFYLIYSS